MAATANPKSEFATEAKRAEVVKHRIAGKTNRDIAELVGITEGGVRYHTKVWLESQRPTQDQTEELRAFQNAQIDDITDRLWPQRDDVAVVDRLMKLMDRKARLNGIDLQRDISVSVQVGTREGLVGLFGLDASAVVVEGSATEITAGDEA